eukprot:192581_1
MALYVQSTPSTIEGCIDNYDAVDLSKFKAVSACLKKLQMFDAYFAKFVENNVTDEAVLCLEKDDVKDLISKIGDRALFMQWLNTQKKNNAKSKSVNEKKVETVVIKKKTCSVCHGKKQISQSESYIHNDQCTSCAGQGGTRGKWENVTVTCNGTYGRCHGGKVDHLGCPDGCARKGPGTCAYCIGYDGAQYDCTDCNGKGTVNKQQFNNNIWNQCNNCGGRGTIPQNKTREKMITCAACKGQGQY